MILKIIMIGLLFLLFEFSFTYSQTKNFVILKTDGNKTFTSLSNLGKIYFVDNNLVISTKNNSTEYISLDSIQKGYFSISTNIEDSGIISNRIYVFPNPTMEYFKISGLVNYPIEVEIFNVFGEKILSTLLTNESSSINISGLSIGVYLVKFNNKMVKVEKI